MKKIYSSPEIEITKFSTEDIITTSGVSGGMTTAGLLTSLVEQAVLIWI